MGDEEKRQLRPAWQALISDAGDLVAAFTGKKSDQPVVPDLSKRADAVVSDAWEVASAVLANADKAAQNVPGLAASVEKLGKLETSLLQELKRRLDGLKPDEQAEGSSDVRAQLFGQLLTDSRSAKPESGPADLHLRILRSLVPDEARILAAMADGTRYPLLHIEARGSGGSFEVLSNACTVGRVAAIGEQDSVCVYVGHLRDLGLLEQGPKEDALNDQYGLLRNEEYVRRAIEQLRPGRRGITEIRRTVYISRLGEELWAACHPGDGADPTAGIRVPRNSAYAGLPPPPRRPEA
ncbi:MAG TPA: Abi-alpha family protein [Pseudonocardia sp.]